MDYRLLIDLEAILWIYSQPKMMRQRLLNHIERIRLNPGQFSDYHEHDRIDRQTEVSLFGSYSVHYWIDSADRHIKILAVQFADK